MSTSFSVSQVAVQRGTTITVLVGSVGAIFYYYIISRKTENESYDMINKHECSSIICTIRYD